MALTTVICATPAAPKRRPPSDTVPPCPGQPVEPGTSGRIEHGRAISRKGSQSRRAQGPNRPSGSRFATLSMDSADLVVVGEIEGALRV